MRADTSAWVARWRVTLAEAVLCARYWNNTANTTASITNIRITSITSRRTSLILPCARCGIAKQTVVAWLWVRGRRSDCTERTNRVDARALSTEIRHASVFRRANNGATNTGVRRAVVIGKFRRLLAHVLIRITRANWWRHTLVVVAGQIGGTHAAVRRVHALATGGITLWLRRTVSSNVRTGGDSGQEAATIGGVLVDNRAVVWWIRWAVQILLHASTTRLITSGTTRSTARQRLSRTVLGDNGNRP